MLESNRGKFRDTILNYNDQATKIIPSRKHTIAMKLLKSLVLKPTVQIWKKMSFTNNINFIIY